MSTTTTPNMNLILPVPSVEPGPTYATEINTAFDSIDSHTHVAGAGALIPTAGLNINANLPLNGYSATTVKSIRCTDQTTALVAAADIGCMYNVGGNMYWNNASGTAIQLTAGSSLNAASIGGIGGDYITSGASMYYTSASATFFLTSSANTPANLSAATVKIAEAITSPNTISLKSPSSLAASYNVTFPAAVPAASQVVVMSSTGSLSVATGGVGTTDLAAGAVTAAKLASDSVTTVKILDANVTTAKIADSNVTTAKIANQAVTGAKIETSVSLSGSPSSAGQQLVVSNTSATRNLAVIFATVSSGASILTGAGWSSCTKVGTGHYRLVISTALSEGPAMVANVLAAGPITAPLVCTTDYGEVANGVDVFINDAATGTATDAAFSLYVIAQRA